MATDDELAKIDAKIQSAMSAIFNKAASDETWAPRKYGSLIEEISCLPHTDLGQAALANRFALLKHCYECGVNQYLNAHPTVVSDLLAITMGHDRITVPINKTMVEMIREKRIEKEKATEKKAEDLQTTDAQDQALKDGKPITPYFYPDMHKKERALLGEFRKDWDDMVTPLLMERARAYGYQKLAAEGLQKSVREWLDTNHESFPRIAWPVNTYDRTLIKPVFVRLIGILEVMNTNPECKPVFDALLQDMQEAKGPDKLVEDLHQLSTCYTTDETRMTPRLVGELVRAVCSASHLLEHITDTRMSVPLQELRNSLQIHVEIPCTDAPRAAGYLRRPPDEGCFIG